MIKISRRLTKEVIDEYKNSCQRASDKIVLLQANNELTSNSFTKKWREIKTALFDICNEKCCYCETTRTLEEFHVDHYRPIMFKINNKYRPGYWWLAYDPENYILSCPSCNRIKSTQFPILNENNMCMSNTDLISNEHPYLLNPIYEEINIEEIISFQFYEDNHSTILFELKGIDNEKRGQKTIQILKLDRPSLKKAWKKIQKSINREIRNIQTIEDKNTKKERFLEILDEYTNVKAEFSFLNKSYFEYLGLSSFMINTKS